VAAKIEQYEESIMMFAGEILFNESCLEDRVERVMTSWWFQGKCSVSMGDG
jgi:hypothetical protein